MAGSSDHLGSASQEVQDPVTQVTVMFQILKFGYKFSRDDGVECRAINNKLSSLQVFQGRVYGQCDGVISGSVRPVSKVE